MNFSVRSHEEFPSGKTSGRITGMVASVNISRNKLIGTRSGPSQQILRDLLTKVSHNNSSLTLKRFSAKSEPGIFSSGKIPGFVYIVPNGDIFIHAPNSAIWILSLVRSKNKPCYLEEINRGRIGIQVSPN